MKKRLLACLLTLCMVISLVATLGFSASATSAATVTMTAANAEAPAAGTTVTIGSAAELKLLADYTNAGKATAGITFVLTADITLNEGSFNANGQWSKDGTAEQFAPIGTEANPFAGTFDGKGYTVNGLYINGTADRVALFGYVAGAAKISNVTIANSYVKGQNFAAAIVGYAASAAAGAPIINNCKNNGYVVADCWAAGIAAQTAGAYVYNSTNNGVITVTGLQGAAGIVAYANNSTVINCLNTGAIKGTKSIRSAGIVALAENTGKITNCLNVGEISSDVENAAIDAIVATKTTNDIVSNGNFSSADTDAVAMNTFIASSDANIGAFYAWISTSNGTILSNGTPVAIITTSAAKYVAGSLADAASLARLNSGCTVQLRKSFTDEGGEIGGTYTLDLNGHTVKANGIKISSGTVTVTSSRSGGTIEADTSAAITMQGQGSLKVNAGIIRSLSTYAIQKVSTLGSIYLSGKPAIQGKNADLYIGFSNALYGADGENAYEGDRILIDAGFSIEDGTVLVKNGSIAKFTSVNHNASTHGTQDKDGNVVYVKYAFGSWAIVAALFAVAAALIIFTLIRTAQFKKKMRVVSLPVALLTALAFITPKQMIFLIISGAVCAIALAYCLISVLWQNKKLKEKAAADKAAKSSKKPVKEAPVETPVEAPVEEAPVEEAPVEEAPVEEAPVEEAPVEEAPVEEAPVEEAPVEEAPVEEAPVEEAPVEEAPVEEAPVEEAPAAAEVVAAPVGNSDRVVIAETDASGNIIYSTYKKSFTARLIQSAEDDSDDIQGYYETLKNALLAYKKVTARLSWSYESFKCGRKQLAKFAIRGKTLCLFLAIDPATLEGTKYNVSDAGKAKKYSTVPCRLRLTSKRSIKWALELIAKLAEQEQLVANPKFKEKSYRMPYETTEALIEKGLVKKVQ